MWKAKFLRPVLKWSIKLLRPALDMERGVTQTRVGWTQRYSDSHRTWAYSGLHLKSSYFLGREVRVLVQNATFALKWGLRLMTYLWWFLGSLQSPLQSFWYSVVDLDRFRNTLNFGWIWASHDWTGNLLRCPELDPIWNVVFMSVLLNFLKLLGKIITSVLETQSSTCHELWFACLCTVEPVELSIALVNVLLN